MVVNVAATRPTPRPASWRRARSGLVRSPGGQHLLLALGGKPRSRLLAPILGKSLPEGECIARGLVGRSEAQAAADRLAAVDLREAGFRPGPHGHVLPCGHPIVFEGRLP